jgi:general secretion pathway protein K
VRTARKLRQRGVAVITALLLTTLAVTIVASLFWQQQVQVRSMENQRLHLQIQWILRGTLDWMCLILRQDGVDHSTYTSLQAVWAVPLANTRIDQYIDRERIAGEKFDASLSGQVFDANARFNLTDLADGGVPSSEGLTAFKKLLTSLRIDPGLATAAQKLVAAGQVQSVTDTNVPVPTTSSSAPKQMEAIEFEDLLDVPGFTPEMVETLRKYVTVLPERTLVNVNTASAEVISAVIPTLQLATAQALVTVRDRTPWRTLEEFQSAVGINIPAGPLVGVKSEYFLIQSWLILDRASLNTEALVNRKLGGQALTSVVWVHQN